MAAEPGLFPRKALSGALFLLGIDTAYNVYGGTNSSPQTTDVFGDRDPERVRSLMKYVWIGGAKVLAYTGIASYLARSWWPLAGGVIGGGAMHCLYLHARGQARKRNDGGPVPPDPASPVADAGTFVRVRP